MWPDGVACAFPRFTPGLAAGNSGGSSGTNAPSTAPSEDTNPQGGTAEPGHQQFIQQMLQALAGVNPQVTMRFSTHLALLFKFSDEKHIQG